jgi:hypothetical protein
MNNKAHTILSGVIASHGTQLMTSNAFCKVYLTGYLDEYPNEKRLLIALKVLELPTALLNHKEGELSETDLFDVIQHIVATSNDSSTEIAWGIDAWAAAVNVCETTRLRIRSQCFPNESGVINSGQSVLTTQFQEVEERFAIAPAETAPVRKSRLGFGAKLIANAAAVSGLMMIQVFGSHSPSDISAVPVTSMPEPLPIIKTSPITKELPIIVSPVVIKKRLPVPVERILANSHHPTLIKIPPPSALKKKIKEPVHALIQIDKPKLVKVVKPKPTNLTEYKQRSDQLLADTEAFLKYGD